MKLQCPPKNRIIKKKKCGMCHYKCMEAFNILNIDGLKQNIYYTSNDIAKKKREINEIQIEYNQLIEDRKKFKKIMELLLKMDDGENENVNTEENINEENEENDENINEENKNENINNEEDNKEYYDEENKDNEYNENEENNRNEKVENDEGDLENVETTSDINKEKKKKRKKKIKIK